MDRKATARETLEILKEGAYLYHGVRIDIQELQLRSVKGSRLYTPEQGNALLEKYRAGKCPAGEICPCTVENISTVDAILAMEAGGAAGRGVLNFASSKNPGGGFINGAMAQEESLAASGGLYKTLTVNEGYYRANRACGTMIYTDHAIYSPDVVFFRNGSFQLIETPVTASVLTLPAVNMGQVLQKGEDQALAEQAMKRRMELALALFAENGDSNLVLGAYGCGVFRNDPVKIAAWWRELLEGGYGRYFDSIVFAVLDHSGKQNCIRAFEAEFTRRLHFSVCGHTSSNMVK